MRIYRFISILFLLVLVSICVASPNNKQSNDENVVVQMNYCINTLTNIIHNKSMSVLEHESDQLLNNLTMEQIIGLYEISDFRVALMDGISRFEITEEERSFIRRIQSIKRDNMKWNALSNALSPTMLLTGGGGFGPQLAFQILLTAARSAIEYKSMLGEQDIEELQAMWELRKEDLEKINTLRKTALSTVFDLYTKYHLSESDRLTEHTANLFSDYISLVDAAQRVRVLQDNFGTYKKIPEYYYHLGMAYLDKGEYANAKVQFTTYLDMYRHNPILRYDEKSGCIALAMLTYENTLSFEEKESLIDIAITNLPSNSSAVLQCAMVYFYELRQFEKGFQLLRSGIDDPNASDRNILFMAAANLLPLMKTYPLIYQAIGETLKSYKGLSYDSYVTYLIHSQENVWNKLVKLNNFSDCYYRKWYTCWICKGFSRKFHLTLPENISFNSNDLFIYVEEHDENEVSIRQLKAHYKNEISEDDIIDVKCFKNNKNLKFLFVEVIEPGIYKLKDNIDLGKIQDQSWPRLSEFTHSMDDDDIEDIIDFCKDNSASTSNTEYYFEDIKDKENSFNLNEDTEIIFKGDTLAYKPHHSKKQDGYYVRIVLNNGLQVVYKYCEDTSLLEPYFYFDGKCRHYINKKAKEEYLFRGTPNKEPSFWSKAWSSITNWFSSDSDSEQDKKEDKEPSFWSKAWSSTTNWFSSDSDSDSEQDKEEDKESSFWSKTWSSITNWFSSDSDSEQETKSDDETSS